jgi:hypothetical protein
MPGSSCKARINARFHGIGCPTRRMGAAAFYDLDGTLVRTNLVHAFAFSARNQQGS